MLKEYIQVLLEKEVSKLGAKNKDVVTTPSDEVGQEITPDVADLVVKTYGKGGFPDAETPEGVARRFTHYYVKDVDDDPEPDAEILYTDWNGSKKASVIATDGGPEAKVEIRDMMKKLLNQPGTWVEASGAPAHIMINKLNIPTLDDEAAVRKMLPQIKDIEWFGKHPDPKITYGNGWYGREINGQREIKTIIGNPPVS